VKDRKTRRHDGTKTRKGEREKGRKGEREKPTRGVPRDPELWSGTPLALKAFDIGR